MIRISKVQEEMIKEEGITSKFRISRERKIMAANWVGLLNSNTLRSLF
jgi:hypothetical protein